MPSSRTSPSQSRRVLERTVTAFNQVTVVSRGAARHLEVDGATYASYHPTRRFFGYAWDALAAAVLHHPAADGGRGGMRVLLIGLGGGTVLHALRLLVPGAKVVAAEIDAPLVDITRRYFALEETGARIVVGDGYAHIDENPGAYDVILDDAFLSRGETARTLEVSDALVNRLHNGLRRGGLLASNVFSDSENAPAHHGARRLFRRHYSSSFELVPPKGHNAIICGTHAPRAPKDVAAHVASLPQAARAAMLRVKGPGMAG